MNLASVSQPFRRLGKRLPSSKSGRWERRLRQEIDDISQERSNDLLLPDFLIIGAPKCATSWLHKAFSLHPGVRMVRDEIEYFSSHIDRPLQWYLSHFEGLITEEDKAQLGDGERFVLGEKSAGYCGISPPRIKLVHRLLPDTRLILMVRDPVSRHWSHAKRYFSKVKSQKKGYQSLESREKLYEFFTRTQRFSQFSQVIENWTQVFSPGQLLVISQEEAFADPARVFESALQHINVSGRMSSVKMKRVKRNNKNSGPSVPMPDDVRDFLERMFAKERESLAEILKTYAAPQLGPRNFRPE